MNKAQLPTLEAGRFRLRWLDQQDADDLFEIFSDPEVTRYWSSLAWERRDQADELVRDIHECFARGNLYQWGIDWLDEEKIVGTCTLASIDRDNRRAEIGFALGRRYWGRGIMATALPRLLDHAFNDLDLYRIEADVDPANSASLKTLKRLGFLEEGLMRARWQVGGEIQDSLMLGLLGPDWQARHTPR